jgi:hypothetical protein
MTLAAALAFNIVAMVALLGGLAHFMSRAKNLKPHTAAVEAEILKLEHSAEHELKERVAA